MKFTLGHLYRFASVGLKMLEQEDSETADLVPTLVRNGLKFANGTEAAVRAGSAAFDAGKPDPKDFSVATVLDLIPKADVDRFLATGQPPNQLADVYKSAYLAKKALAGFKAAAASQAASGEGTPKP